MDTPIPTELCWSIIIMKIWRCLMLIKKESGLVNVLLQKNILTTMMECIRLIFKNPSRLRLIYNDEISTENTVSEYINFKPMDNIAKSV